MYVRVLILICIFVSTNYCHVVFNGNRHLKSNVKVFRDVMFCILRSNLMLPFHVGLDIGILKPLFLSDFPNKMLSRFFLSNS
jgi:hypothetical protein